MTPLFSKLNFPSFDKIFETGKFEEKSHIVHCRLIYIMCLLIDLGCDIIKLVGDGVCNDETNTANCNFDGGDCCLNVINKEYCSECKCFLKEFCGTGFHPLVGDGLCHDETNIVECNFDGGDCCLSNVNKRNCSECICHIQSLCATGIFPSSIADGSCNDETNNQGY